MTVAVSCLDRDSLRSLLEHGANADEIERVAAHLETCSRCGQTVDGLLSSDPTEAALRGVKIAPDEPSIQLLRARLANLRTADASHETTAGENTQSVGSPPSIEATQDKSVSLAPAQLPDEMGRLGGYRILAELGRGGMGVVYKAEDLKLKRLVALKVMAPSLAANAVSRERFLREAVAMAAVHHDNIVVIHTVDEANGVPFLAMEFLQGMPLDKWLKDGRKTTPAQVLRIGREIAEGLAAAHERGLIHRDVKPGNIWLDSAHKGRVKILDFGLARSGTEDVHLTHTGAVVGTPAYMAPEQARAEKVDARSDLFSLGCVLYRLCTGTMPFTGDTTMALLMSLATDHPKSVRELNPDMPAELSDLVMRLLAKSPAERPASAREVVSVIEAIENNPNGVTEAKKKGVSRTEIMPPSLSVLPPLPPKRRRTAVLALLAGAAAVVLALAGAVVYVQTDWGTLEISTFDPDVKVSVEQDGNQVDILDSKSKQQLSIHSGTYTLKVLGADGAAVELTTDQGTGPVTLTRGGKVVVAVNRVDKPAIAATPAERAAKSAFPPLDEAWAKKVRGLPAEKQIEEVAAELKRRNPGFDGKMEYILKDNEIAGLTLLTDDVADLTPLEALPALTGLSACGHDASKCRLLNLSTIKDLKLTKLKCDYTRVSDLSPLKGMLLTQLECNYTRVSDLSPLKGMPLTKLSCWNTQVSDLSPIKDLNLQRLTCQYTEVSDLSPLKDMKLTELGCDHTRVTDLSFLKTMPLKELLCDVKPARDAEILRSIKTLEMINGKPAAEFWKEVDGK